MGGLPPTCQTIVYDNGKQIVLCIKQTAKNRTQNESIDNLYDALKRRNLDCFKSFLAALLEHEYGNLWMAIIEIGITILSKRNHQL